MTSIVGVSGPVGGGKTTLVGGVVRELGDATAVDLDQYETVTQRPLSEIVAWMARGADVNEFAMPEMTRELAKLKRGESLIDPASQQEVAPGRYVLFETNFGTLHRATAEFIDLLIWIDVPLDVALARKAKQISQSFPGATSPQGSHEGLLWLNTYFDNYLTAVADLLRMQRDRMATRADLVVDGRQEPATMVKQCVREILCRLP
jgi:uridine kinase